MFSIISDLFEKVVQSWWSILLYVVAVAIIIKIGNRVGNRVSIVELILALHSISKS